MKKLKPFAILTSTYHAPIINGMLDGALEFLHKNKAKHKIIEAPGAFEMPLLAKKLAQSKKYSGVICLGCVIKGDTAHFEYISEAVAHGLMQAGLETGVPIAFGILTTYTEDQAVARAQPGVENKGLEAARACFESAKAQLSF